MTVIARRIAATPARLASETWKIIVDLLAPDEESASREELLDIIGVASSLIADEAMESAPLVVYGAGLRVRVYCLYGEDAISGENSNEASLPVSPTQGDWKMSLPCPTEDLNWVQSALKKRSSRITARDLAEAVESEESEIQQATSPFIDKEAFYRP